MTRTKKKTMYVVNVVYPANPFPQKEDAVEKLAGRYSDSSGLGFGERDIEFYCDSKAEMNALANKLAKDDDLSVSTDSWKFELDDDDE